jgi:hypothetical protein
MFASHPIAGARPRARRLALGAAVVAATLGGPLASLASASPSASCDGRIPPLTCTIIEPNVNEHATAYPQVQFLPGDHVTIRAGGCVQTGGHGLTWKRYVNPASDNDLYHGLISIPGAFGLVRIQNVVNSTVTVGSRGALILGYEDDNYGDNGYWGHDNGTGNQCLGIGAAWVTLSIT